MDKETTTANGSNLPKMALQQRLKLAREYAGFKTPKSFAEAAGISNTTYHQYESGRSKSPRSNEALEKLAKAAHVNFEWLKYGTGNPIDNDPASLELFLENLNTETLSHTDYREHDKKLLKMIFQTLRENAEIYDLDPEDEVEIAFLAYDQIKETSLNKIMQYKIVKATVELALRINAREWETSQTKGAVILESLHRQSDLATHV